MIGKKTRESFFNLLHDTDMTVTDLAKLIEINGVHYVSRWGDWEAALPNNPYDREAIEAALTELETAGRAFSSNDLNYIEEFEVRNLEGGYHPLHDFGFNLGQNDELLVDKTPLQTQEDLLRQAQSDLINAQQEISELKNQIKEISTWTGFDDVDDGLMPIELDVALMVYRDAINQFNPDTGRMANGDTPKEWIKDKVFCDYLKGQNSAAERISIVANWQKAAGRPSKS
jgi:hypothetical protein